MAKETKLTFTFKDLVKAKKPLANSANSVDEVTVLYLVQYLKPAERIAFINELYRVMKKGAKCQVITAHWCSNRAYADLRVEWPPVAESWYYVLKAELRTADPNYDKRYKCDFDSGIGYSMHPAIVSRNQEYQHNAVQFSKEAAQDLCATLTKR